LASEAHGRVIALVISTSRFIYCHRRDKPFRCLDVISKLLKISLYRAKM
jgi:hypothetical protein